MTDFFCHKSRPTDHRRIFNHFGEIDGGMFSVFATLLIGPLAASTIAFISGLRLRNLARVGVRDGYGWHKY